MNKKEFEKGWRSGLPETRCGNGSRLKNTKIQRAWIPEMVAKYGIKSIADIGAGDLNWAALTVFGCDYTPYDLIPRAQGVIQFDLLTDKLPEADCLMVLWVINHLTKTQAKLATRKIVMSGSRYLFTTYRPRLYGFFDCAVLESVVVENGAEIRLIVL